MANRRHTARAQASTRRMPACGTTMPRRTPKGCEMWPSAHRNVTPPKLPTVNRKPNTVPAKLRCRSLPPRVARAVRQCRSTCRANPASGSNRRYRCPRPTSYPEPSARDRPNALEEQRCRSVFQQNAAHAVLERLDGLLLLNRRREQHHLEPAPGRGEDLQHFERALPGARGAPLGLAPRRRPTMTPRDRPLAGVVRECRCAARADGERR